ncbi:hypothetical protein VARIO8X_50369 [Burkholderiales bacterium 8X]|nr:hypothetical protein VARIO8X_50369 [Burkholderiales bacterium 8X]
MTTYPMPLEQAVIDAVLDLFEASGSPAFCLTIPGTDPTIYIACGEAGSINIMMPDAVNDFTVSEAASNQAFDDHSNLPVQDPKDDDPRASDSPGRARGCSD